jgi:hypothetical protein
MSDDPFAAFKENQPPATNSPAPGNEKKKRKRKKKITGKTQPKKRATSAKVPPTVADTPKPKKTRKPRQAKELRLPISTLLGIGSLSDEESGVLMSIAAGLQKLSKKSRGRITAALGKIF